MFRMVQDIYNTTLCHVLTAVVLDVDIQVRWSPFKSVANTCTTVLFLVIFSKWQGLRSPEGKDLQWTH